MKTFNQFINEEIIIDTIDNNRKKDYNKFQLNDKNFLKIKNQLEKKFNDINIKIDD